MDANPVLAKTFAELCVTLNVVQSTAEKDGEECPEMEVFGMEKNAQCRWIPTMLQKKTSKSPTLTITQNWLLHFSTVERIQPHAGCGKLSCYCAEGIDCHLCSNL